MNLNVPFDYNNYQDQFLGSGNLQLHNVVQQNSF